MLIATQGEDLPARGCRRSSERVPQPPIGRCPGTGSFHVQAPQLSVGGAPILRSAGKAARGGVGRRVIG